MLKIENFHRNLIGRGPNSKNWWVSGIDESATQYWIYISDVNNHLYNRINIEKTAMNEQYEIWFWYNHPDPAQQIPIRQFLSVIDLRLGASPLLELIDYMLTLNK